MAGSSSASSATGINSLETQKRARSIQKSKFIDSENSLFLDGKRNQHEKSFTD